MGRTPSQNRTCSIKASGSQESRSSRSAQAGFWQTGETRSPSLAPPIEVVPIATSAQDADPNALDVPLHMLQALETMPSSSKSPSSAISGAWSGGFECGTRPTLTITRSEDTVGWGPTDFEKRNRSGLQWFLRAFGGGGFPLPDFPFP